MIVALITMSLATLRTVLYEKKARKCCDREGLEEGKSDQSNLI